MRATTAYVAAAVEARKIAGPRTPIRGHRRVAPGPEAAALGHRLRRAPHPPHPHHPAGITNWGGLEYRRGLMTTTPTSTRPGGPARTVPAMRRRRGMTDQARSAPTTRPPGTCGSRRCGRGRGEMLVAAKKERRTYQGFLAELLLGACDERDRRRSARRVKATGFPQDKWVGDFDFAANPSVNPATICRTANGLRDLMNHHTVDP